MDKLAVGILAHVDAGKTTLSEAILYLSGRIKKLGRVDHRDAFLDHFTLERERGITIFSKQAIAPLRERELTLLDTPGHMDFSAEMERTLQVLDCAILVVSGTDGVQSHTETLWRLLKRYEIPVFLFVNKMDLAGTDRAALLETLRTHLDENCLDFGAEPEALWEELAMCAEELMEEYLSEGALTDRSIARAVARRQVFPCFFGSALKLRGVDAFLDGLERYTQRVEYPAPFGALVYKIARDSQGNRLTYLKVTGGTLRVKMPISLPARGELPARTEKIDQIRLYSGAKFTAAESVPAGTVCAVTGLSGTYAGQGLGAQPSSGAPLLEPVLTYQVLLPKDCDPRSAYLQLRELEEEDPQLHLVWDARLRQLRVQLMGQVQLEILRALIRERFGLAVQFGMGEISYRETIAAPVIGAGHFEPLRHYAEVHLLLEPEEAGSGLSFDTVCSEDVLDRNWQRLILTHLEEKTHLGVLTGSPITDMKLTLLTGRAHLKHTEGGDFRQATYRAVRQGLMQAKSILLEPWYELQLELPRENLGRAISDFQLMDGESDAPVLTGDTASLTARVPVSALGDYASQVAAYTRGRGRMTCRVLGYRPCHETEKVVERIGYRPEADLDNPADSVFCSHGAGTIVPWNEVRAHLHLESGIQLESKEEASAAPRRPAPTISASDQELEAIFARTYGPVKRRDFVPSRPPRRPTELKVSQPRGKAQPAGREFLLVDGYNIIFAWDDLKALARDDLDAARQSLIHILCNYQGYRGCCVILVFDAYKVPNNSGSVEQYNNIYVVYTKQAETADMYIEKVTYEIGKHNRIRVATSDRLEQLIILGHGAVRVSASAFQQEVRAVENEIAQRLKQNNQ